MKKLKYVLPILILIFCVTDSWALTVSEILDRHAKALGDSLALRNFSSLHTNADIVMGTMKGKMELFYQKPDKIRLTIDLSIFKMEQGLYNGRYWVKDQTGNLRDLTGAELRQFVSDMYLNAYDYVLEDTLRRSFSLLGEEGFDGKNCYKLEFLPPGGEAMTIYLDSENYFLLGSSTSVQGINVKATYSDWREVDGLKIPFKIVQDMGNPLLLTTITTTGIEINTNLPEGVFLLPTSSAKSYRFADQKTFTSLPFTLNIHHIYLPVYINGKGPFIFILDSGAGMSIMGRNIADSLGLKDAGSLPAVGVGGVEVGSFCRIDSLRIGEVSLYDLTSGMLDLTFLNSIAVAPMDGILGYDLFSHLIVDIDYEKQVLSLYDPELGNYSGGADTLTCEIETNHPMVTATLNDSIQGRFRMDTGSHNFLDLNSPMVRKYHLLDSQDKKLGSFPIIGVGGTSGSTLGYLNSFTLGRNRLTKVLTGFFEADSGIFASASIDGNIGGGILSGFEVGFDYPHGKIYLTKTSESGIGDGFITSGILLRKLADGVEVFRIMPGSAAADVGLMVGDKVIKIGRSELSGKSLSGIYELLKGKAGKKIWIFVEREGKPHKLRLALKKSL